MKITLFILALLSLATFTHAETFLAAKQRRQPILLQTPEDFVNTLKKTDFGKTVLNLASLQFKSSGKLDDVVTLLNNLEDKLRSQQADDDQRYSTQTDANNQVIAAQNQIISNANQNIQNYQSQLTDAQSSLSQLQVTQAQLEQERDLTNSRLQGAVTRRAKDAEDFAARTSNSELLIKGLQKTVTLFQQATANKAFDAQKVQQLENLLNNLEAAFQASIAQDTQLEDQAIQDYNDLVSTLNAKLAEIEEQLEAIALEIARLQALIVQLTDAIASEITTRDNAQALLDRTVQAQKDLDQKYSSNKAIRADQVRLLSSAVQVLSNNSADAQNYLNQA